VMHSIHFTSKSIGIDPAWSIIFKIVVSKVGK
jgi:hypothetical protein